MRRRPLRIALLLFAGLWTTPALSASPIEARTGWYLGLAGVYAFESMNAKTHQLGVDEVYGGAQFDPEFDDSAGIHLRAGFRPHSRFAFEFAYEWLEGFDATVGDPPLEIDSHLISLDAKLFALESRVQPYVLVGGGLLIINLEVVESGFKKPYDVDIGFTGRFGGGLDFHLTRHWTLSIEGTYLTPSGDVKRQAYGTLGGGVQYHF